MKGMRALLASWRYAAISPRCRYCGRPLAFKVWKRGGRWVIEVLPCPCRESSRR